MIPISELLAEMEARMPDVTPGPWKVYDGCSWRRIGTVPTRDRPRSDDCAVLAPIKASDGHPDLDCSRGNDRDANLEWIAQCSPHNIARIIAWCREMEALLREALAALDECAEARMPGQARRIARLASDRIKKELSE